MGMSMCMCMACAWHAQVAEGRVPSSWAALPQATLLPAVALAVHAPLQLSLALGAILHHTHETSG